MTEYLTLQEVSRRIKMAPGTLRNLVWKKELQEGNHYIKPTPRKLIFLWSAVEGWLWRNSHQKGPEAPVTKGKSLIDI